MKSEMNAVPNTEEKFEGVLFYTSSKTKEVFTQLRDALATNDLATQELMQKLREESASFSFSLPQCYIIFGKDFIRVYLGHKLDREEFPNGSDVSYSIMQKPGENFWAYDLELIEKE